MERTHHYWLCVNGVTGQHCMHRLSACQPAIVVSLGSFSGVHLERRGQVAAKWGFRNREHTTRARDGILQTYSTRSEITRP
jgi:hypothetical protein